MMKEAKFSDLPRRRRKAHNKHVDKTNKRTAIRCSIHPSQIEIWMKRGLWEDN